MRNRLLSVALVVLLVGAGCARVFQTPDVRLSSVSLGGLGLRGGTVVARLQVENPNGFDLEARSFTYDLQLRDRSDSEEWVQLATGTVDRKLQVGGNSATVLEIPIEFSYADFGPALRSIMDRGTFDYRVSGEVRVSEPLSRNVPYRKSGRVTLQGVQ